MTKHSLELFADYFQFYLQDEAATGDHSDAWTPEAVEQLLAIGPGVVGVGTVRNVDVPVEIELVNGPPATDLTGWDRVNECTLDVPSGRIVVAGCTDYFPEAMRISVAPGTYRARVYYGGLKTVSENGLEGEDRYRIALWRASASPPVILKAPVT